MPGIVGLITKRPRPWAEQQLASMVKSLLHEPFYTKGTWSDESMGVYVGWVARENSFSDSMPLRNERDDVVLVFSGEDYPEPGTARRLKERGHRCEEGGPSYLVPLYEDDPDFFKNLNGRFQGVVADRSRGTAVLFNDRFGLQRVYFHEAADAFYFSAEAKAILAVRPELRRIDPRGLGEYVACGCVLENRTLFQGIYALPPGSAWSFRGGTLEKKGAYFDPREWEEQEPLDAESYYSSLREAFTTSLPRYFNGRERVGVSLTGGLDTRIIMAWRKAPPGSLPCYTFGSMYRENQDVYLARRVAEICGQPYQVVTVDGTCLARFPHYAERTLYLTDGCVDISRSADLYNNEMARQIAPVRMVGTFGSEIIRKAVMFKAVMPTGDIFRPEILSQVARAAETYRDQLRGHRTSMVAFRQTAAYHFGVLMLEQTQLTLRSPYLDNGIVRTVFRAPRVEEGEDVRLRLIRDGSPALARLAHGSRARRLEPHRRGDQAAVIWSSRSRLNTPTTTACRSGSHDWITLSRRSTWSACGWGGTSCFTFVGGIVRSLQNMFRRCCLTLARFARPYLNRSAVEAAVRGHLKGDRNYTTEIHRLLSLELLHRLFVDAA